MKNRPGIGGASTSAAGPRELEDSSAKSSNKEFGVDDVDAGDSDS